MRKLQILHKMPEAELIKQSKRMPLWYRIKRIFLASPKQDQHYDPLFAPLWTIIRICPSLFLNSIALHTNSLLQAGCQWTITPIKSKKLNLTGIRYHVHYKETLIFQVALFLQIKHGVATLCASFEYGC